MAAPTLLNGCGSATEPFAADVVDPAQDKDFQITEEIEVTVPPAGQGTLAITSPQYGRWILSADDDPVIIDADPGRPMQFYWQLRDGTPLGQTLGYRYGWDVTDVDDFDDPGWFGPPRNGYKSQQTQPLVIWEGARCLTIECWDDDNLLARATFEILGMPVTPRIVVEVSTRE